MLRVVAFRKAALAGAAGAVAWEAAARSLILAGVPLFDIVRTLGTLLFPDGPWPEWWFAGIAAHCAVGIAWALVYAYFFWARLDWPPTLQGLAFAAVPAVLAFFIASPQLALMHLHQPIVQLDWASVLPDFSAGHIGGLILGHAVFGLTVGVIYTHPVGYSTEKRPAVRCRPNGGRKTPTHYNGRGFVFATGIECSYPTVEKGRWRFDEMRATRHYDCWSEDFELARRIGVSHLRYGPPLHLIFAGPGRYDWDVVDAALADLQQNGPEPIVDLCHFGVPSWLGDFQNPDVPNALAEYARAFAERYPGVRFYTPVNEMFVCARMSALEGAWNEQRCDERAFVNAVFNLARASVLMTDAILAVRPDAVFVNSESSEFNQACCPDEEIQSQAQFENERRFLPLDLIYGHEVSGRMRDYLQSNGAPMQFYHELMAREVPKRSILGVDYYEWNEKLINQDGDSQALGELFGWYVIANQYWQRYQRVMMHTETHRLDPSDGPRWLWRQWHNVQLLRAANVPLVGFTWYSVTDQVDWEIGLTRPLGRVDPVGLFDLNRDPRPVALSYRHLIEMHRDAREYRECEPLIRLLD